MGSFRIVLFLPEQQCSFLIEDALLDIVQLRRYTHSLAYGTVPLCHLHYALEMRINGESYYHPPQTPTSTQRIQPPTIHASSASKLLIFISY